LYIYKYEHEIEYYLVVENLFTFEKRLLTVLGIIPESNSFFVLKNSPSIVKVLPLPVYPYANIVA
jgi:hypothetical protein